MQTKAHPVTLVSPDGNETCLEVGEDEYIWEAAFRAGLHLPSMCLQGWCITCAGQVEGSGQWDQTESQRYFPRDREGGYILLCTAKPRSALRIHTHRRRAMRDFRMAHRLPVPRR